MQATKAQFNCRAREEGGGRVEGRRRGKGGEGWREVALEEVLVMEPMMVLELEEVQAVVVVLVVAVEEMLVEE